ncbi:MAG: cytochrome o ubiquinol oxidase subunit IV [Candidatus Arsenophonus melophagi]|nr:cytochrome o ubiquinol oxidase subunit IV [Candidatus Arsenophonus melophagi]
MSDTNTQFSDPIRDGRKFYLIGFILSILLTIIPFLAVMYSTISHDAIFWIIISSAIFQILVHLVCFLHLNTSSHNRWNFIAFLFTILIIGIITIGSLWIMYNLNINMMLD